MWSTAGFPAGETVEMKRDAPASFHLFPANVTRSPHPMSPAERFLICALAHDLAWHRRELRERWQSAGDDAAWVLAVENDAASIAGLALQGVLGPEIPARWNAAVDAVGARIQGYMGELDRIADALAQTGIRLVALKNAGIARGIFHHPAGSPMGDVDALVDPARFEEAHRVVLALGYELALRSPSQPPSTAAEWRDGGLEYSRTLADGSRFWFELQWRPVSGKWIQKSQEPPAAVLLARSTPCPGSAARLLAPVDNLLVVCLHTAKHSYVRAPGLRLHTDVDRIVRLCAVDWSAFAAEVERLRVMTAVYFSLRLPADLMGTPVPDHVLARLAPPAWKERLLRHSIERAGFFAGRRPKWGKAGYVIFNLLLYDSGWSVWRALFPPVSWMRSRYGLRPPWTISYWYAHRLFELLFKSREI